MLIDVHAHLSNKQFSSDLEGVIKRCKDKGVVKIISNGLTLKSNLRVLEISKQYEIVEAALGLHPMFVLKEDLQGNLDLIIKNKDKIIAIGEIGMDFLHGNKDKQRVNFSKMIELGERFKKPIIVHSREAEKEIFGILEKSSLRKVIMHYFTGDLNLAKKIEGNGWYFSIPGTLLINKSMQDLVKQASISNLLTETDSPFFGDGDDRNEPWFVFEVIKKIAEIKKMDEKEVESIIYENYKKIFKFKFSHLH